MKKALYPVLLLCSTGLADEPYVKFQEPEFLTYDELVTLVDNPKPEGALGEKLEKFWTTPVISNEAWYRGVRREPKSHPEMGDFLRLATWNIEKSYHMDEAIAALTSEEAYREMMAPRRIDPKSVQYNMLRQRSRLASADILMLQEMDIGVSRSDYVDATRKMAEALDMNYAYGAEQLEIDPVLMGREQPVDAAGVVDEEMAKKFRPQPGRYKGVFGSAVLSRYPIKHVEVFQLKHQPYDWYEGEKDRISTVEKAKRLGTELLFLNETTRELKVGGRIYLRVDLHVPGLPNDTLTVINIHLEIKCPPEGREEQMKEILEYIKDIPHHVVMGGDFNSASVDISPTNIKRIASRSARNPTNWLSLGISALVPQSQAINTSRQVVNRFKNFQDPLAPNIPVLLPNHVKPMFDRIGEFRFDDGAVFDCRGEALRSMSGINRPLANSNDRSRYKGFRPSFSVKRPIGFIGQQRLDWIWVKRFYRFADSKHGPYRWAPHFGETLYEFNCGLKRPISDHSPNLVDLPLQEPEFPSWMGDPYRSLRFDEDWRRLEECPDTYRPTISDSINHIPLDGDGRLLASFGTELRERVEYDDGAEDDTRLLHRLRLHAGLELNRNLRVFVEGINAASSESDRGADEEDLDLLNGFAEWDAGPLALRLGRQQLEFGRGRLISVSDWRNVPRSWDGGSAAFETGEIVARAFYGEHSEEELYGIYATAAELLDVYYFRTDREEEIDTVGLRLFREAQPSAFDYDLEVAWQDQDAVMVGSEFGYSMAYLRVHGGLEYGSRKFDPLFADEHRFLGIGDLFARRNVFDLNFGVEMTPNGETSLAISHHLIWQADKDTGLFTPDGDPVLEEAASGDRLAGNEIDITYRFNFSPSVRAYLGYSFFLENQEGLEDRQTGYAQLRLMF